MKRISFLLTIAFVTSLSAPFARALTNNGVQINYNLNDGLSNGYVLAITEDSRKQLWVATESGINRFDGKRFISYTKENSGLVANELNDVLQDPDDPDLLWIASQRNGLTLFSQKKQTFSQFSVPGLESMSIVSIKSAPNGGIWFTNYNYGAFYYNHATGEIREYSYKTIKGLPQLCYTSCNTPDGKLFIGHVTEGLSVVDTVTKTFVNYRKSNSLLPDDCVHEITPAENGYVWIGTENGAAILNPWNGVITPFMHNPQDKNSIPPGAVHHILKLKDGSVMFATSRGGVCILPHGNIDYDKPGSARFIPVKGKYPHEFTECLNVRDIHEDSYGNLWIGYYRSGVDVLTHMRPLFLRLDCMAGSSPRTVFIPASSCIISPDGKLWIGGDGEIVSYDDGITSHYKIPGMSDNNMSAVVSIAFNSPDNIIASTSDYGAYILRPSSGEIHKIKGLPQNVRNIVIDPLLGCLFATNRNIWKLSGDMAIPLEMQPMLHDHVIQDMERDSSGNLWIGNFGQGLSILTPDLSKEIIHHKDDYFQNNAINDIMRDSGGRMWVASRNGLIVFDNPSDIYHYKTIIGSDSLQMSHIMAIAEDKDGNIWATSDNGVIFVNRTDLSVTLHESTKELPLNTFSQRGACVDQKGRIYIASANGVFKIDPYDIHTDRKEMPVILSSFISYKEGDSRKENEIPLAINDREVTLPHNQATFKISFNVPDLSIMRNSYFAYNLEGLDDAWIELQDENSVTFRSLPPGNYRFRVKSRFKGGSWSSPVTVVSVKILPPWWLSWWALSIYAFIATGIIILMVFLYTRRIKLKERLMSEIAKSQDRQELNEERLRFFTNITHELRTPLTLILGPIEDMVSDPALPQKYTTKLRMIRESSTSLLSLINGILEFRKTETQNRRLSVTKGNISNLVYEIGLRFKELNTNKDVSFILDIDRNVKEIYYDRDMISTMLNNILSNAVKYTRNGSITLTLNQKESGGDDNERTEISVADTGYGMSKESISKIFGRYYQVNNEHQASGTGIGLALVKNLADLHNAEIRVDSEEGKGSTFTISLLTNATYPEALHPVTDSNSKKDSGDKDYEDGENKAKIKILVVEDNDDIKEYIRQSLLDDYDIITASNGLEGLKAVHDESPSIVVSDVMMPEMDGVTLCSHIKEDILTCHIPVILLTAKDSLQDREAGYESGADSYLTKPFTAKLLRGRIRNIITQHERLAKSLVKEALSMTQTPGQDEETEKLENKPSGLQLSPLDRKFLDQVKNIIIENLSDPALDVQFIAEKMCMSYSTLYRKIKSILDISMLEYIRGIRMAKAKELIEAGELSISEVAYSLGYGGHSSFGKIFRKEFGMSPSEYADKHRIKTIRP